MKFKKIYLVDLGKIDTSGFLVKREIADLMNLADSDDICGAGTGFFTLPFVTIESVIPLGPRERPQCFRESTRSWAALR